MSRWLSRRGVNKAILSRVLQRRACSTYRSNEHTMYRSYETWRTLPRRPTLDLIPARAHTPCVSPGGNYDSIRRVNGIVWIGRVSARLWYYSEEQMESCRPFVWSSYSFNFRTWERERKKQSERERERGGRNGDRGRVCASIQGTKIRRWCSRKRKRTKIAEPWRNYFGASPIIWTTVRIAMIHGSAVTFVERDHFRGFRISAWVINARRKY